MNPETQQNFIIIAFLYGLLCVVISTFGKDRKIGITNAFMCCFFCSPIIGVILTTTSPLLKDLELTELQLKKLKKENTEN